ncbi:MAG: polysaccharide deacetylase family protein, partial [Chlamydiia bacterium]|nr:polysaccharide deacetylase family protein [Chlamydiia bacterium]
KALLAVPTAFIPDKTTLSPMERLEKIRTFSDHAPPIPSPAFCTWSELKELSLLPLIQIASHSIHHRPLTAPRIDPEHEYLESKKMLEAKLGIPITSFVYPYGKMNPSAHDLAKKHYLHIFRIGNALNKNWHNTNSLLYRVNADQLPHPRTPFRPLAHLKHHTRYLLNTVRGK